MRAIKFVILFLLIEAQAFAKGLDELKPGDEPASEEKKEESKETPAAEAGAVAAEPAPVVIEPSATSLALANKLTLGTSLGFVRILQAKEGSWNANFASDLELSWTYRQMGNANLVVSFRYLPIEASTEIEDQHYRGILEGYHLGSKVIYPTGKMHYVGSIEVGYLIVYLDAIDQFEIQEGAEKNEIIATVGGGADWLPLEKVRLGPRVYVGFGAFQTLQISGAATFVF